MKHPFLGWPILRGLVDWSEGTWFECVLNHFRSELFDPLPVRQRRHRRNESAHPVKDLTSADAKVCEGCLSSEQHANMCFYVALEMTLSWFLFRESEAHVEDGENHIIVNPKFASLSQHQVQVSSGKRSKNYYLSLLATHLCERPCGAHGERCMHRNLWKKNLIDK